MGMTLGELNFVKLSIEQFIKILNESGEEITVCKDPYCVSIQCKSMNLINREINLKTMNPVLSKKDDSNCSCCKDIKSNTIIDHNPACPEHGISQQLNKSQMK